jgi:hypothetical protein
MSCPIQSVRTNNFYCTNSPTSYFEVNENKSKIQNFMKHSTNLLGNGKVSAKSNRTTALRMTNLEEKFVKKTKHNALAGCFTCTCAANFGRA